MLVGGVCSVDDPSRERLQSPVPRLSWQEGSAGEVTGARTAATTGETAADGTGELPPLRSHTLADRAVPAHDVPWLEVTHARRMTC